MDSSKAVPAAPTSREYTAKFLRDMTASRIRRMRDTIDRIERQAEDDIQRAEQGKQPFGRVAAGFEHEVMTMMFNLHIDTMINTASDGDREERTES